MSSFFRQHRNLSGVLLAVVVILFSAGCTMYRHADMKPENSIKMVRYYVLNEDFPLDYAWLVDVNVQTRNGLEGALFRLTPESAGKIVNGVPQSVDEVKKLQIVVLYLKNDDAMALLDSTQIHLSFDRVRRSKVYEYSSGKNQILWFVLGGIIPAVLYLGQVDF